MQGCILGRKSCRKGQARWIRTSQDTQSMMATGLLVPRRIRRRSLFSMSLALQLCIHVDRPRESLPSRSKHHPLPRTVPRKTQAHRRTSPMQLNYLLLILWPHHQTASSKRDRIHRTRPPVRKQRSTPRSTVSYPALPLIV